jgi:hypothetical protein
MRSFIVLACVVCAAFSGRLPALIEDADQMQSLAAVLLASIPTSGTPSRHAVSHPKTITQSPKLMTRRQSAEWLSVLAAGIALPMPASAGSEETAMKAYEVSGFQVAKIRDYFQFRLPKLIENGDWAQLKIDFKPPNKKGSKSDKSGGIIYRYRRAMLIYYSSGLNPYDENLQEVEAIIKEVKAASEDIITAAIGIEDGGGFLFFKSTKEMEPAKRKSLCLDAKKRGDDAIARYIVKSNARPFFPKIDED